MVFLRLILVVAIAWIGFRFGTHIGLGTQWPLYEALRTTTSIVFGIMAALLSLVYPDVVKNALRGGQATQQLDGGLTKLIAPCGHSALLLILLVAAAPFVGWLSAAPKDVISAAEMVTVQKAAFSLFCVLSYWQVTILLMAILPFDDLYTTITQQVQRGRMRDHMHRDGRG